MKRNPRHDLQHISDKYLMTVDCYVKLLAYIFLDHLSFVVDCTFRILHNFFIIVGTIAERPILGLFTLTKPIIFGLGALEYKRFVMYLHLPISMSSITERLRSAPAASTPNIYFISFTMISERYFVVNMTKFWSIVRPNSLGFC